MKFDNKLVFYKTRDLYMPLSLEFKNKINKNSIKGYDSFLLLNIRN